MSNRLLAISISLLGLIFAPYNLAQQPVDSDVQAPADDAEVVPAGPAPLITAIKVTEPVGSEGAVVELVLNDDIPRRRDVKLRIEGNVEVLMETGGTNDYREGDYPGVVAGPISGVRVERAVNNFYKIHLTVPDTYVAKKYDGTRVHIESSSRARRAWKRKVAREDIPLPEEASSSQLGEIERFMEQAEQAMAEERYNDASRLYWLVLRYPDSKYHPKAMERYGFAHYRAGRLSPALREYERYLEKYPEGEDVEKVTQLLAVIRTARQKQIKELKKRREERKRARTAWRFNGSISSNFRQDHIKTTSSFGNDRSDVSGRNINTYAYFNIAKPVGKVHTNIRFSGSHREALLEDQENDDRISRFYASVSSNRRDWIVAAGKQSQSVLGPIGDFFGIYGEYKPTERTSFAAGWGKRPDREALFEEDNNREFAAVSAQIEEIDDHWNIRGYYMEDYYGDLTNRKLLGLHLNGIDRRSGRSIFISTDYDFLFEEWNSLVLRPSFTFFEETNLQLTLWKRKSVPFQILNALRGQRFGDIEELQNVTGLSQSELIDVASELDSENERIAVRLNQPLYDGMRFTAYISHDEWENVDAIQAILDEDGDPFVDNAGRDEVPGRKVTNYSTSLSVSGDELYHSYGLAYSEGDRSERITMRARYRWRITEQWRLDPSFRYLLSERTDGSQERDTMSLLLRGEYRPTRKFKLRAETGITRTQIDSTRLDSGMTSESTSTSYYFGTGFQWSF